MMAGALTSCETRPLNSDQQAHDAILALEKLEAKVEAGIAYRDYSAALGDTSFLVKQFLDGNNAKTVPRFSNSLRNGMRWYQAAQEVWRRELEVPVVLGYCAGVGLSGFRAKGLCDTYPELVTIVPGTIPSEEEGLKFSINMLTTEILLEGFTLQQGKEGGGSPGIIYDLAIKQSWRRAAFEVQNGKRYLAGDAPEQIDGSVLKSDRKAEMEYLVSQAKKSLAANQ